MFVEAVISVHFHCWYVSQGNQFRKERGSLLNKIKLAMKQRTYLLVTACVATAFVAPAAVAQGIGSLDRLFGKVESAIRDQARKEPAQIPAGSQGNQNAQTTGQREVKKEFTFSERDAEVAESQNSSNVPPPPLGNRKASSFDNLMGGDQPARNKVAAAMTKAAFFEEFERMHLDSAGKEYLKVASSLAMMLPAEYGVSTGCVQSRYHDGRVTHSSEAVTIASAMYDVIDQLGPSGPKSNRLRDNVNSLFMPGMPCRGDSVAIKQFLTEYTDYARGLLDRKQALVSDRKAREQEQARQAKIAADQQAQEKAGKEREAQARDAEMRRQNKEATEKRTVALRLGGEKPASFSDYTLMHQHKEGYNLFVNPKVEADNNVYLMPPFKLERADSDGLLVTDGNGNYILVKKTRSTAIYGELKINWPITTIGKYVGNTQYTTVIGAVKTAAVIEAIAIKSLQ